MDVEVYFGGQRRTAIAYHALPALRLFCRQYGFQLRWDPTAKRIDLEQGLHGKVVLLAAGTAGVDVALTEGVLGSVQKFLHAAGAEVVMWPQGTQQPVAHDVALRFAVKENKKLDAPRIVLLQADDDGQKGLKNSLLQELKHTGLACQMRTAKKGSSSRLFLPVQWQIPPGMGAEKRTAQAEKISFYLAAGILGYFSSEKRIHPFSYLPPQFLQSFLGDTVPTALDGSQKEEVVAVEATALHEQAVDVERVTAVEQPAVGQAIQSNPDQAGHGTEADQPGHATVADSVAQGTAANPAVRATETNPAAQITVAEPMLAAVGSTVSAGPVGGNAGERLKPQPLLQVATRLEAEVYFDYTLMHSERENRPYLLIGTLLVKNTGTEHLYNPLVCLRVSPVGGIEMGGQIIPPKMVETLGVQSSTGAKGWKYLDDDWFEQAQSRGEYWIAPIQPMFIPPKMSESFQNFQISFLKQEARTTVTVEGAVFFNDQQLQSVANNRIAISF